MEILNNANGTPTNSEPQRAAGLAEGLEGLATGRASVHPAQQVKAGGRNGKAPSRPALNPECFQLTGMHCSDSSPRPRLGSGFGAPV